ncbi:ferredoxin [Streptomyces sp. NPDC002537]
MTWRVTVDRGRCMGSGICAALAPEFFELSGERSRALTDEIRPDETALDAADSCPALAITVTDGNTTLGPRPD